MYSYQKAEPGVWMVGQFRNDGSWERESRWSTQEEAAEHAHMLNDGKDGKSNVDEKTFPPTQKRPF